MTQRMVVCPSCGGSFNVKPTFAGGKCPKCQQVIPASAVRAAPPVVAASQTAPVRAADFSSYLRAHWRTSRGTLVAPLLAGLLLLPVLSLLKPVAGARGIALLAGLCLGIAVVAGIAYLLLRVVDYLRRRRTVAEDAFSPFAWLARGGLVLGLCFLVPAAAAEWLGPPEGILVRCVPRLAALQPRQAPAWAAALTGEPGEGDAIPDKLEESQPARDDFTPAGGNSGPTVDDLLADTDAAGSAAVPEQTAAS